jgi:hypothetical protein
MAKVVTGKVRLSYVHVFEPGETPNGDEKYSVCLIIPKTDTATIAAINNAIEETKNEGKQKRWGGKIPANLKTPLRDGDTDRPDQPEFAGSYFLNASSKLRPPVFDIDKSELVDRSELYSGCYAKVIVNFYPYDTSGSRGVAAGLNGIKKVADGARLDGTGVSVDEFGDDDDDFLA